MRRQLLRLVEASELPMVTIQVLPFSVGAHRALAGSFVVLEFASGPEHALVHSESLTGGLLRDKPEDVRSYRVSFEALRATALSPEESVQFITSIAHER
jgi:hypothetical protein